MSSETSTKQTLQVRAAVNRWISDEFPEHRRFLSHTAPVVKADGLWQVRLRVKNGKAIAPLADLEVDQGLTVLLSGGTTKGIADRVDALLKVEETPDFDITSLRGKSYDFRLGDGIAGSEKLDNGSVDLLLTDPPYSISNPYTCETQVPRRLRKDGRDFIMPKGHFGQWDYGFSPAEWTSVVLPKVKGWAVFFCAQEQIGEYSEILREHQFVAVGTLVWQKTNPVPFNHTHKPINAWEALVVGKRSGTKFNGRVVHNVFVHKSPSPQERIHPTQKPLGLVREFIELFSSQGDLVLDPFAGSATTVMAAVELRRRVLAFEKDPALFQAASRRIASSMERLL